MPIVPDPQQAHAPDERLDTALAYYLSLTDHTPRTDCTDLCADRFVALADAAGAPADRLLAAIDRALSARP